MWQVGAYTAWCVGRRGWCAGRHSHCAERVSVCGKWRRLSASGLGHGVCAACGAHKADRHTRAHARGQKERAGTLEIDEATHYNTMYSGVTVKQAPQAAPGRSRWPAPTHPRRSRFIRPPLSTMRWPHSGDLTSSLCFQNLQWPMGVKEKSESKGY